MHHPLHQPAPSSTQHPVTHPHPYGENPHIDYSPPRASVLKQNGLSPLHEVLRSCHLYEPRHEGEFDQDWCDAADVVVGTYLRLGAHPCAAANDGATLMHTVLDDANDIGPTTVECLRLLLANCTDKSLLKKPRAVRA